METTKEFGTILGQRIAERLNQLGISRREFCRTNRISRQTLQEIINSGKTNLLQSTFTTLDKGLHWEPGTSLRYSLGDENAREAATQLSESERVTQYLGRILNLITSMPIAELEREAIWLEEEALGRTPSDLNDHQELVIQAMEKIAPGFRERLAGVLEKESRQATDSGPRKGKPSPAQTGN